MHTLELPGCFGGDVIKPLRCVKEQGHRDRECARPARPASLTETVTSPSPKPNKSPGEDLVAGKWANIPRQQTSRRSPRRSHCKRMGNIPRQPSFWRRFSVTKRFSERLTVDLHLEVDVIFCDPTVQHAHGHTSDFRLDLCWWSPHPEENTPGMRTVQSLDRSCRDPHIPRTWHTWPRGLRGGLWPSSVLYKCELTSTNSSAIGGTWTSTTRDFWPAPARPGLRPHRSRSHGRSSRKRLWRKGKLPG